MAIKKTKRSISNVTKTGQTKSRVRKPSAASVKKKARKVKRKIEAARTQAPSKITDVDRVNKEEVLAGVEVSWAQKIRAYRERQDSVASILDETMGVLAKCDPKLWSQRAYWMLVGLVYERLAICEDEISTGELVSLAKVLAENRRVEVRSRSEKYDAHDDDKSSARNNESHANDLPTGELPEGLVGTVRQLYGVELEDSNHKNGNSSTKNA